MMFHTTQLLLDKISSYEQAGQWQSAVEVAESVFQSSWRAGHINDVLEILLRLGFVYNSRNEYEIAGEYFELVVEVASRNADKQRLARAFNGLGIVAQQTGDMDSAIGYYRSANTTAAKCGDQRTVGDVQVNLGILSYFMGERRAALRYYKKALQAYETSGNRQRVARVLNNLAMLYTALENYAQADSAIERALNIAQHIGDRPLEGIVLANKAELLIASGEFEAARLACDEAFEISSQLGDNQLKAEVYKCYGVIFRDEGKPYLAESHLRQAIELASSSGLILIEADAHRELALVLRSEGRNREALEALNTAHAMFASLQAKTEQAEIDRRFAQLEADFLKLVEMWGESIEAKDRYTRGHCQRVAEYACHLASRVGLPQRDLVWFRMGAFLHDVGKTEIPEEILNKPGKLNDEERRLIERHTIAGDEILSSTEFPYDIRPMVRWHHERWDGRGYPDGLAGEQIPLSARILHIVDVFDALTTTRSYRKQLAFSEAIAIMRGDEASFDPTLLALFCELMPEFNDIFARDSENQVTT